MADNVLIASHNASDNQQPGIILYGFPSRFRVRSSSPFDMKTEVQLKMIGIPFQKVVGNYKQAPKGKLPYISDQGSIIADSTLIRFHLEQKYGVDIDVGLTDEQRAIAWATERLVEDNLYWAMVWSRWALDENFEKGPARVFDQLPVEIQDVTRQKQRATVLGYLDGQGLGRHTAVEITAITKRGYWALSKLLGDKPYMLGDDPCSLDASVYGQVASALTDFFDSPVREAVMAFPNLVEYNQRMTARYFPNWRPQN